MINQGYAGVFVSLFNEYGEVITNKITRFTYVHSDKLEDVSTIVLKFDDPKLVDHPNLQVDQRIIVAWGYTNEKEKAQKRILWIYDISHDFTDMGIKVTLECFCKAGYLRFNSRLGSMHDSLDGLIKSIAKEAGIGYETPEFKIDVNKDTRGPSTVGNLSTETESNVTWHNPEESAAAYVKAYNGAKDLGATDAQADVAGNRARIAAQKSGNSTEVRLKSFDPSTAIVARDVTSYQLERHIVITGGSDAKTLKDEMKRSGVADLLIEGRDDNIIVSKRNWGQKPYKFYAYKQEPGNVLKFMVATHNKEIRKQALQVDFSISNAADKAIQRGSIDNSHKESTALGKLIELTNESLSKQDRFKDLSVMVSGIKKKTVTESSFVGVVNDKVEYSDVKLVNGDDKYVAIVTIRGTKEQLDEYDKAIMFDIDVPDKYKKPPIAGALSYGSIDGAGMYSGRNYTERGRLNNSTHLQEDWDGKGIGVITRMVAINPKTNIQIIEDNIDEAAKSILNELTEDQLALREASLDVIGDPGLISGKIISLTNVGLLWEGNYYIHKAVHEVNSKGYVCKLELYKNATNKISGLPDNYIDASSLGIPVNKDVASAESIDQGGELKVVLEEVRPEIANQDT